jgi:hypothetical protein
MSTLKNIFLIIAVILLINNPSPANETSPVTLNTRLNVASFSASQVLLGHMNLADPDFMANYFLSPYQSIGAGLDLYISTQSLSLWSWRFAYKYYFIGQGYPVLSEGEQFKIEQWSKHGVYSGVEAKNYHYFISSEEKSKLFINNENIDSTGNYYNINLLVGYEYRFNNRYAANIEANETLFSIAASDERFSTKATILLFGLTIKL